MYVCYLMLLYILWLIMWLVRYYKVTSITSGASLGRQLCVGVVLFV